MRKVLNRALAGLLISGSLFLPAAPSYAWGYDGHRIAANIATQLLTPKARIRVGELLMGGNLADVASYMDDERKSLKRQIPGSDKWHYDNIPVCTKSSPEAICPGGNCASARIEQLAQMLGNKQTDRATQVFALKALVHLIADIHQPLHAADDGDHGANDVAIGSRNLHSEWDSGMLKKMFRGQSTEGYAQSLYLRYGNQVRAAQSGNSANWAAESHDLAVRVAYGALPGFACGNAHNSFTHLPQGYFEAAAPVIETQLVRSGARIAFVLNQTLGG